MTRDGIRRKISLVAAMACVGPAFAGPGDESPAGAEGSASGPGEHVLVVFEETDHLGPTYAVIGQVRAVNVTATENEPALLETLNYFDGNAYFSRETTRAGTVRSLAGSAEWRSFTLPFSAGDSGIPEMIELRAILPGAGTVEIRGVRLVESIEAARAEVAAMNGFPTPWWSARAGGWIGGGIGSFVGLLGATVGVLTSLKKGRRAVFTIMAFMIGGGVVMEAVGLFALATGQPYAVWYPFVLIGLIMMIVAGLNWIPIRRHFEAIEMKRLAALDA